MRSVTYHLRFKSRRYVGLPSRPDTVFGNGRSVFSCAPVAGTSRATGVER